MAAFLERLRRKFNVEDLIYLCLQFTVLQVMVWVLREFSLHLVIMVFFPTRYHGKADEQCLL